SISNNNVARDIDLFRQALGETQMSFAMFSNSGPVGAVYAGMFPERVRAMILDSPVGPNFRDSLGERPQLQAQSYDLALERMDQVCCPPRGWSARSARRRATTWRCSAWTRSAAGPRAARWRRRAWWRRTTACVRAC